MTRQRKVTTDETTEPEDETAEAEAEAEAEETPEPEAEPEETTEPEAVPAQPEAQTSSAPAPPAAPNPNKAKVNKVSEPKVKLPVRDLAGMYKTTARCSYKGKILMPNTEVQLSNADARHYLSSNSVVPLD